MPLVKGFSRGAVSRNVGAEKSVGKPIKQAVAIALVTARGAAKKAGKRLGYLAKK